jgi:hypothetical protein
MSDFAAPTPLSFALSPRRAALFAAGALGLAVAALSVRLAPGPAPACALGGLCGGAALTLAALVEARAAALWAKVFGGLAAALGLLAAAPVAPGSIYLLFALASLAGLGFALQRVAAPVSFGLSRRATWVIVAGLVGALAAFNAWYVIASRDLEIADFMFYRVLSIAVATLARAGKLAPLLLDLAGSMKQDYSWAPALAPGLALAAFGPLSRAVYQGAILICYATPALLALAWLAREISGRRGAAVFVFALIAVFAACPFAVVVAARGMPDIGGLALYVLALRLADRLARALALKTGRGRDFARKLGFALALTLFAMFLYRRWYAFAAVGIGVALGLEIATLALRRGRHFAWREAGLAAAIGLLTLLGLLAPVLADWMQDPAAHDYARMYAAYRKTPAQLAEACGDWVGFGVLVLALAGAGFFVLRGRLARMTLAAAVVSALLFLRVQSPYPHHFYLLAPALAVFVAAPLIELFARSRLAGAAALAALAAATLTPAGALAPRGVFPVAGWPRAPRADLAELARLKNWVDARARPDRKVCGLGSSYTFSAQLIDELWQLKADKSPLHADATQTTSVAMSDVDTVDGPPKTAIKDCAFMLVGDPVQTHVIPSYQLTVTLPAREMLEGAGIGAHYRRTGEAFSLEHGVHAVVFEQVAPLTEADMAALQARWRAGRAEIEAGR